MMPPLKPTLLILLLVFSFGFAYNTLAERGIPLIGQWDPDAGTVHAGGSSSVVTGDSEISLEEAYARWESGEAVFIDARTADFYNQGHVPGAISIPVYEYYDLEHLLEPYGKDHPYVLYCGGADCADSHRLRQLLEVEGFTNLSVLGAGWPGWASAGYPQEIVEEAEDVP